MNDGPARQMAGDRRRGAICQWPDGGYRPASSFGAGFRQACGGRHCEGSVVGAVATTDDGAETW